MDGEDTGMPKKWNDSKGMVPEQWYQTEHILQQIKGSARGNIITMTALDSIVPVSISTELSEQTASQRTVCNNTGEV